MVEEAEYSHQILLDRAGLAEVAREVVDRLIMEPPERLILVAVVVVADAIPVDPAEQAAPV